MRIGVSPLLGIDLVSQIAAPLRSSNPAVEIVFREMNLAEMRHMLEVDKLDFVFGPTEPNLPSKLLKSVRLMSEPLVFLPKGGAPQSTEVVFRDIVDENFVMVPDSCGLTKTIRAIFKANRYKLKEYAGAAMSYRVLEEWARHGIAAAILPRSKIGSGAGAEILRDKISGDRLTITYEVYWRRNTTPKQPEKTFATYLKTVAPTLAAGLSLS